MDSSLATKRRRLNNASSVLSKPFVSPLKSAIADRTALAASTNASNRPYTPSTLAHTVTSARYLDTPSQVGDKTKGSMTIISTQATPVRKPSFMPGSMGKTSREEQAAQRAVTSLETRIRRVKNEIDTLSQAARILNSNKAAELESLAEKWRCASQDAAEELFGSVKERVNRMGGVAAWKETEKKKNERFSAFENEPVNEDDDADCEFDSQGEELPEEEQEARKNEKKRLKQEMMDAADRPERDLREEASVNKVWNEPGKDDDTFTMDMMLRSLNIELDVIGWDQEAQRWMS